ncbi:Ig-like domain-containing protein [Massilia phyllosphaerae]|uniref:Ig-like domain-containing protein n=1 Tax=Massilia phyllosphaerae TaxID=3106034 RepID=UPI002B1CADA7|nr:Ig-like domain-containing protein [Massilia sp. SGZ-792]
MNDIVPAFRLIQSLRTATIAPRRTLRRTSRLLPLEQRFMFDGAAVATAADAVHARAHEVSLADAAATAAVASAHEVRSADAGRNDGKKEVVFVDTSVADYRTLEAGLRDGMAIIEFDGARDGLAQIAAWAARNSGYDAIHILSHGAQGQLHLGSALIDEAALASQTVQAELADIGHALKPGGDVLLYGCDVAAGSDGERFLADLARLTGADVAASTDATGSAAEGGNWTLESHVGEIDVRTLQIDAYRGVLDTIAFTDADADFTSTTIDKLISGIHMTFSGGYGNDNQGMGIDTYDNNNGVYAYQGPEDQVQLTIKTQPGYSFDINSFGAGMDSGQLSVALTYANGATDSFTINLTPGAWQTLSSFAKPINDVTQVVLSSDKFGIFQNFNITDVKPIAASPTVTDANIAIISSATGLAGTYKIGDTVTARWNNGASGDNNSGVTSVTMDFSQFGGSSAVTATGDGSGNWSASYTIVSGAIDATGRKVSVSATNGAGTATAADSTNLSVDNVAPTVTDARIAISGASGTAGAYKIGDTVTATWNNTAGGDNNTDTLSRVTVDFSQFGGGSAVIATNSGGVWSATYTIGAGAIDATGRNVSVTAVDNAGNATTTADSSNATVDNVAPLVTDANIAISGASGTNGAYRIGDTVTATWNNTAGGDNNTDALAGVTIDFSQFGGGSAVAATNAGGRWSATYRITAGGIDATGRNVSVKVVDNAGNATVRADTSNATVDSIAPTVTFGNLVLSNDTGSSATDFITNSPAQTIGATLSGVLAAGDVVYGSLDNGATWTDISGKVAGTTLNWDGVTLSGSNVLQLKVVDKAGNDGSVASQAYALDTTPPATPSRPAMSAASDTGSSASDGITRNMTPTFSGSAEAGSTVAVYADSVLLGTTVASGGAWTFATPAGAALADGSHTITARATDVAGNMSNISSVLVVSIDTAAPTGLALAADSAATQAAGSGATLTTLVANDNTSTAAQISYQLVQGDGTNDADNARFTLQGNELHVGNSALTAGNYHLYVSATDLAGNVVNQALAFTVMDAPSVTSVVRTGGAAGGVDHAAASVQYTVTFSQPVTGVDGSDFTLTSTGTAHGTVAGVSGSGDTYIVTVDSLGGDGTLRLDLNASGTGIQSAGNAAIAGGYTAGAVYTLDHTAPAAPSVPAMNAASDTGNSASDGITSNTTPTFSGSAESGSTVAVYADSVLLGTTVASGGAWTFATPTGAALADGSHTITAKATDAAGNMSAASGGLAVVIDTAGPAVGSVAVPSAGVYRAGQSLTFTVNTNEAVTLDTSSGVPRLALQIGSATAYADYLSGAGSNALVFGYTVRAGDNGSQGIAVAGLQANGGLLRDQAGNDMALDLHGVGVTAGVLVDTTAPTVTSVAVPAQGTYVIGQHLDFTVNFSEAVTVSTADGTPRIALTLDNGGTVYANYLSAAPSGALTFRYVVTDGVQDLTGITVGTLSANGGALRDAAGNDAALALNTVGGTVGVNVDGQQAHVLGVGSSTSDGAYGLGATISITVTFNRTVVVDTGAGVPSLALGDGGVATYAGGSGSATLVFTYRVATGENAADLDYASSAALALNGGAIRDTAGARDAMLDLAAPGSPGSLGTAKNIVIDTTAPSIVFSRLAFSNDNGASANDFVTDVPTQTVTASLSAALAPGDIVYGSLDNGAHWTDITAKVSGTSLAWNDVVLSGSGTLQLKVTDQVGNDGTATVQAYKLAIGSPSTTFTNIALSNDSGISATDFVTRISGQTVSASLSAPLGAGDVVYGSVDGGAHWVDISGMVSGTALAWDNVLVGGANSLAFKVVDAFGHDGPVTQRAYVLDTTAPGVLPTGVTFSNDTGASATDLITSVGTQTLNGTLSTPLAAGDTVYVSLDKGTTWATAADTPGQAGWTLVGQTLKASNTLLVKIADVAGNETPAFARAYVLQTAAPVVTFTDLALSNDSGASSNDFVTNVADQTMTATLGAPLATGDVVRGSLDGGATWVDITSKVNGTRLTWDGVVLPASGTLAIQAVGASGLEGKATTHAYVVDTTPPAAFAVSPFTSTDTRPILSGTIAAAPGDKLVISVGGASYGVTPADGGWRLDLASAAPASGTLSLAAGNTYAIDATLTDLAGNASKASGTLTIAQTAPPVAPEQVTPETVRVRDTVFIAAPAGAKTLLPAGSDTPSSLSAVPTIQLTPFVVPALDTGLRLAPDVQAVGLVPAAEFTRSDGAFPVVVVAPRGQSGDGLILNRPLPDQAVAADGTVEIAIPSDAFAHTDAGAAIHLSARQANGQALPSWIQFDAAGGKFIVQPHAGMTADVEVRVTARDAQGREAVMIFRIKAAPQRLGAQLHGRAGFSEQVRQAADGAANRFDRLLRAATRGV